jgi:hypothetical protein
MHDAIHSTSTSHRNPQTSHLVDNTDWLKTAAIILVAVDHFGHFFMQDDRWWSVFGRLAAPTFFFLLGYAQTRTVPFHWIWLGVILTLLESWNANWTWVAPNILLSFALIRCARPYVQILLQRHGWAAFVLLVSALLAVLSIAAKITARRDGCGPCSAYANACMSTADQLPTWMAQRKARHRPRPR